MSFKFDPIPFDDAPPPMAELPAELEALGEQLQADALRLGQVYPACRPPLALMAELEKNSLRRRYVRTWVLVASSAAALLLMAITLGPVLSSYLAPPEPAAAHAVDPTNEAPQSLASLSGAGGAEIQPVVFRPALADVNGPELEGLLDLLDDQPQTAAAIAF